jgi:hypothetical protein
MFHDTESAFSACLRGISPGRTPFLIMALLVLLILPALPAFQSPAEAAAWTVTSTDDNATNPAEGTLRHAVQNASDYDVIVFASSGMEIQLAEELRTWRNTVADNGFFDLNPQVGVITFRICSVRAKAEAPASGGGSGGCNTGTTGASGLSLLLLLGLPLILSPGYLGKIGGKRNP